MVGEGWYTDVQGKFKIALSMGNESLKIPAYLEIIKVLVYYAHLEMIIV